MNTGGRLVAGSRNRNEFVVINADEFGRPKPLQEVIGQNCQICGDGIELIFNEATNEKELFVACNECAFPVCRTCYEYEREGKALKHAHSAKPDTSATQVDGISPDHHALIIPAYVGFGGKPHSMSLRGPLFPVS
ncbi:hypothetical protein J5N97_022449 [Dioscorea zingiberensis]|uniref:Cellulose synthase RING-type zinc finger domain-containing protein n=1 Tax=Dioscorea zingiberensis TaxID=325984 RepID=A0A9D5HAU4_9LILI|nr:hypothetical protein J5N97_022449 [Dioscorea zingiberensis]